MRITKKSIRFITVIILAFVMMFSFATTAFAAGVETWYGGYVLEPVMSVYGYNLTPTKTMGVSGTLYVEADFRLRDNSNPAVCVLEIRSTDGTILAHNSAIFTNQATLLVHTTVSANQKIRIYTSVYDYSSGAARSAYIQYSHEII